MLGLGYNKIIILLSFLLLMGRIDVSFAASTGTVTITGQVPIACNITVTPESGASNIANLALGDTNRLVATVNEDCNDPDGYGVTIVGTNSTNHTGLFIDTVSGDSHPFNISYNGANVTATTITDVTAPGNTNKQVRITYGADSTLTGTAGFTYTETMTFTISAK